MMEAKIKIGGLQISYREKGQGKPLVLMHGLLHSAYTFRYVIEGLAVHWRLVAPDLPGSGLSGHPIRFDYSLTHLAELLRAFMLKLRIKRCAIGGVGTGGALALTFAVRYPDIIEKIILIDSLGLPASLVPRGYFKRIPGGRQGLKFLSNKENLLKLYRGQYANGESISEKDQREYLDLIMRRNMPAATLAKLRAGRSFAVAGLVRIDVPTLVIWGERDRLLPKRLASEFIKRLPKARYVMIPEAGHLPHEEKPEDFNAVVIEFLRGTLPIAG